MPQLDFFSFKDQLANFFNFILVHFMVTKNHFVLLYKRFKLHITIAFFLFIFHLNPQSGVVLVALSLYLYIVKGKSIEIER